MLKKIILYFMLCVSCQISHATVKNILFGDVYNKDKHSNTNIIITNHSDNTWTFNNPVFDNSSLAYFSRATCTGDYCIAVGNHEISGTPISTRHVILSSQDGGETWSSIRYIKGINTKLYYLEGGFNHLICYEKQCYLSGEINNFTADDQSYSLIISEDGGKTWAIPTGDDPLLSLPKLDFYCINNQCLSRSNKKGTFIMSEPNGQAKKIITLDFPDAKEIGVDHLQPSGNNFIAMGYYITQSNNYKPITIISNDGGEHWQEKSHDDISVDDLTCHKQVCLASSRNFYPDSKYPVLMLSRDSGQTWNLLSVSSKAPSNDALSMTVYKSICTEKACTMIGTQHLPRGSKPIIATVNINDKDNVYHITSDTLDPNWKVIDILCNHDNCYIAGYDNSYDRYGTAPFILESDLFMSQWNNISDQNFQPGYKEYYRIRTMAISNH